MKQRRRMTKEEFIRHDAKKNHITMAKWKKILDAEKCDCGHWVCPGWVSVSKLTRNITELKNGRKKRTY